MHLDDERIERLIHGELTPESERGARGHVETCEACAARVRDAEREERSTLALLGALDHAVPTVRASHVMRSRQRAPLRIARWAAAVLIAASVAGVAYAAPGSPLPRLVRRTLAWIAPGQRATVPAATPAVPAETTTSGVAVAPGDRFRIVFRSTQERGQLVVTLTDGPEVVVRARGEGAAFTTGRDQLVIANAGSVASYEVAVPSGARHVAIDLAGRELMVSELGRVRGSNGPEDGRWVFSLAPPPR